MKYILLPFIATLISLQPVQAQFRGGANDGYSFLQTKGIQNNTPGIYSGGPNDGHSSTLTSTLNASPSIYSGGANDGFSFQQAKGFQNTSPSIYSGGSDDGFSLYSASTQNATPEIYMGGSNDGFALALTKTAQNAVPSIYLGGANDGVDMFSGRGLDNELPHIYSGGANDGDAEDGYSFAVSFHQNPSETLPPVRNERTIALIQLTGNWFNEDAVLGWKTTSIQNLDHFELQRSEDGGKSFRAMGNVDLNPEAGSQQEYRFTDVGAYHLPADYLLYRLKSIDKDGAFRYSAIVRLALDKSAPVIAAYPNPTSGRFTLALLNVTDLKGYGYVLTSNEGKILKRGNIEEANTSFDLSGYASANYHLFLYKDGKSIQHFTILLTQ